MKITDITSEVFEWERPGIWNGGHFYGPGRLHKVTVHTDEGITGYGWNGGTAAERPLNLFPGYVDYFKVVLASGKYGGHKIAVSSGCWADFIMTYSKGKWNPTPWCFPDFTSGIYDDDLKEIRRLFKIQRQKMGS